MAGTEDGLKRLEIQEMWPNEALHFTPWLAKNLHLLGDAIGMELELVQREKAVGSLSLDILAKDANTGNLVAIENLYGWTDVDHLGRLFIYAAGCNAPVSILIAEELAYEHAQTLHRMNEWTRDDVKFYGVKVEVIRRSGKSDLEPRLRKVVYPGGWDKDATAQPDAVQPQILKYRQFFKPLADELRRRGIADSVVQNWNHRDRMFRSRVDRKMGYQASISESVSWVTLHIRAWGSVERSNRIFDELLAKRSEIEASVDIDQNTQWQWDRSSNYLFSSISVKRGGSIDDCQEKLDEIREWMLDLLVQFQQCFEPRLEEILTRLS